MVEGREPFCLPQFSIQHVRFLLGNGKHVDNWKLLKLVMLQKEEAGIKACQLLKVKFSCDALCEISLIKIYKSSSYFSHTYNFL